MSVRSPFMVSVGVLTALLAAAPSAPGYVDASPTLGRIVQEAVHIVAVEVEKLSLDKGVVLFKKKTDLKGVLAELQFRHHLGQAGHPRERKAVLDWARQALEARQLAILFINDKAGRVCLGSSWYECVRMQEESWWMMTRGAPELSLAFSGPAGILAKSLPEIVAGKEAVLPAVMHDEGSPVYRFVAEKRPLRGREWPVWRVRVSLSMPSMAYNVSRDAANCVAGMGAAGPEDLPRLVRELDHQENSTRLEAAETLGRMGPEARSAAPALRKAVEAADPRLRVRAAEALGFMEPAATEPGAALSSLLKDGIPEIRRSAAEALGNLGIEAAALAAAIKDSDADVRWSAIEALGRIGPAALPAVPALIAVLDDPALRSPAADALGSIGSGASAAGPALASRLKELGRAGVVALARVGGEPSRAAVPFLIEELKSDDHRVRWDAVMVLGAMGPLAREAAPALLDLGSKGDAMAGLTAWSVDRKVGLPYYVSQLKSAEPGIRPWIASELGWAKDEAKEAVRALTESLADPAVAKVSSWALALIAGDSTGAVARMTEALGDPSPTVRQVSIAALGRLGPEAAPASTGLMRCLKDPDPNVRAGAAGALAAIGPAARVAAGALDELLRDDKPKVRQAAEAALKAVRP